MSIERFNGAKGWQRVLLSPLLLFLGNPLLVSILLILGWGFWISPDFKIIAAGVAIFLLGMMALENGFKAFTGGVLEKFLQKTTDTTFKSLLFGIFATTVMQSSSLVSVITISFISAELIALAQGIGIIFGSNIGTTTGAWLVAGFGLKVDIAAYAMPMLVFGVILQFKKDNKVFAGIASILIGLGFLFLGIAYMKEGFDTFSNQINLAEFAIPGIKGLIVYTLIGMLATVVMQSSHATLILTITALAAGQVSYENALALAIGSNIGTTITAILGALGANIAGKRLAGAHLIFNAVTGLLALVFIQQFMVAVEWVSNFCGIEEDNYTLKLAVFHTIFNVVGVSVNLPFVQKLVNFLNRFFPDPAPEKPEDIAQPHYLNASALQLPDTALHAIMEETRHLATNAFEVFAHGVNLNLADIASDKPVEDILGARRIENLDIQAIYQRRVKPLYSEIIAFSARAEGNMIPDQVVTLSRFRQACQHIVASIKQLREFQSNQDRYARSENPYISNEYQRIRRSLVRLLRVLATMGGIENFDKVQESLDTLRAETEMEDVVNNGTLTRLIKEDKITAQMASSLINDSGYAFGMSVDLIEAARDIYGGYQSLEQQASLVDEQLEEAREVAAENEAGEAIAASAEIDAIEREV